MSTYTLKCGCVALVEFERLVSQCAKHEAEWKEIHERAMRENEGRQIWLRDRAEIEGRL